MTDIPEQPAAWPPVRLIATTDRVLGGEEGAANQQAIAILQRAQFLLAGVQAAQQAVEAAQQRVADALTTAGTAATTAGTASTVAASARSLAQNAQTAVAAKATRYDLGTISVNYAATVALGAGSTWVEASCPGAIVGDAIFVSPTAGVTFPFGIGAAQCLAADKIRVCVNHPALVISGGFTIPVKAFALR